MAGDKSQKTEKPTPKRIREAREKGQVARTPDLSAWASMLGATVLVQVTVSRGSAAFRGALEAMGPVIAKPDEGSATRFAVDTAWRAVGVIAPLLVGMMVIGVAAGLGQVGLKPTLKKLQPDFKRLNPLQGLKRTFGVNGLWEMLKALAKTAVLVVVAWPQMTHAISLLTNSSGSLVDLAGTTGTVAITMIRDVAVAGLAIAAIDYMFQRRRLMRDLRMSRHELREEMRQQEGNPEMRRAVRSRQMAISRNRMIRMVSGADVVIVNPTHYSVALRYDSTKGAPEVVAKGAGVLAARIRTEAEKHDVPIVREPVLTRTLYASCDIGQLIPIDLYEAVAQVLAFVFGLRARGRAAGTHTLPRPALALGV